MIYLIVSMIPFLMIKKIELRIYEIKSIFDYYAKKIRRGKKLSKAQLK